MTFGSSAAAAKALWMPKSSDKGKGDKGTGNGKSKEICKGSSAGVGGAYAAPGRPKIFRPTDEDRKQTGNIAEYFKPAEKTTPQPLAPVFASAVSSQCHILNPRPLYPSAGADNRAFCCDVDFLP